MYCNIHRDSLAELGILQTHYLPFTSSGRVSAQIANLIIFGTYHAHLQFLLPCSILKVVTICDYCLEADISLLWGSHILVNRAIYVSSVIVHCSLKSSGLEKLFQARFVPAFDDYMIVDAVDDTFLLRHPQRRLYRISQIVHISVNLFDPCLLEVAASLAEQIYR